MSSYRDSETPYDYTHVKMGGHQVVARQVVEPLGVAGIPAKTIISERLNEKLMALNIRDLPDSLMPARIAEAIEGVAAIRVLQCRHKHIRGHEYLHYKQIRYPAFLWPIYRSIGDVVNPDEALELRVELAGPMLRFAEADYNWALVEETLRAIDAYGLKHGLEMATALPKGKDGNVAVLTFLVEAGRLLSHTSTKSHVDALIRATTDFHFGTYVWGTPRWEYNNVTWYHNQMRYVVDDAFRVA